MNQEKILLDMMESVHQIAVEKELQYFLAYGSLIGAVREKGMIPWDEEIDILVKSTDYSLFIDNLKKSLPKKYEVLDNESEGYELYFARVIPRNSNHHDCHIDVFPLVGTPNNQKKRKKFVIKSILLNKLYYIKSMDPKKLYKGRPKRFIQAKIVRFLMFFIPTSIIKQSLDKNFMKYDVRDSDFLYTFGGSYGYRELYKKEDYDQVLLLKFNNYQFFGPQGYDRILKQVYGDYMEPKKTNYLK